MEHRPFGGAQPSAEEGGDNEVFTQSKFIMGGLNVGKLLCKLCIGPVEMGLRPHFGTRYFDLPTMITQFMLFNVICICGMLASNLIPNSILKSNAFIGFGILQIVFYAGCVFHGWRIWQLMNHMDREPHSEREGNALSFYKRLPKGDKWSRVRVVYEPLTVIGLGAVLYFFQVMQPLVALYLVAMGFLLALSACFYWYQGWLFLRISLDRKWEVVELRKLMDGGAEVPQTIRAIPVGQWIPKEATPRDKVSFVAEVLYQDKLPAELQTMLSPVKPVEG